jgi:hypothetical protein
VRERPTTSIGATGERVGTRLSLPPAALLAVWGTAAVQGRTSLDEALDHVAGTGTALRVSGLPGEDTPVGLSLALGRLRAAGTTGLRLVLPRAGDPAGLPGPVAFNTEALAAGAAVLTTGPTALGLLPELSTTPGRRSATAAWRAYEVAPLRTTDVPSLAEADLALQTTLRESVDELVRLDVARWRPEVAEAVAGIRQGAAVAVLPPGHPARAVRLLGSALRVAAIVDLAGGHPGAAVSAAEMTRRQAALGPLERASRYAVVAACNAALEPHDAR